MPCQAMPDLQLKRIFLGENRMSDNETSSKKERKTSKKEGWFYLLGRSEAALCELDVSCAFTCGL